MCLYIVVGAWLSPKWGQIVDDVTFFPIVIWVVMASMVIYPRGNSGPPGEGQGELPHRNPVIKYDQVWSGMVRYCQQWKHTSGSHQPTSSANEVARTTDESPTADPPKME
jgi:hypothetical protein